MWKPANKGRTRRIGVGERVKTLLKTIRKNIWQRIRSNGTRIESAFLRKIHIPDKRKKAKTFSDAKREIRNLLKVRRKNTHTMRLTEYRFDSFAIKKKKKIIIYGTHIDDFNLYTSSYNLAGESMASSLKLEFTIFGVVIFNVVFCVQTDYTSNIPA